MIMNTFWLKIAVFAVVIVGVFVLVSKFSRSKTEPAPRQKTFSDVIREDDKRLRGEPETVEPPETLETEEVVKPAKRQFKELSEADKVQAERLFEMALAQRKMGRLPGVSYKLMVDYCRQIIEKYPDSSYAFKAKRMLGDIPERYRRQYKITDEEINLKN